MPEPLIKPKRRYISKDERQKRLEYILKKARGSYVEVGIIRASDVYPESNVTVGQVAAWMEFGTHTRARKANKATGQKQEKGGIPMVPSRSFLRTPVDKAHARIEKTRDRELEAVIHGEKSIEAALQGIGVAVQAIIQNAITRGIRPRIAKSTLKRKMALGQPQTPLIATRFMYDHISYGVVLGS